MEIQITAPDKYLLYDYGSEQLITEYLVARNAADATEVNFGAGASIGQDFFYHAPSYDYWWKIRRGAIYIDLTSVSAGTSFGSAVIAFEKNTSPVYHEAQDLVAVAGDDIDPVGGLVVADYGELLGDTTELGKITGTDWVNTATPLMTLNATGRAYLEARCGTLFALALRGSQDIAGTYSTGGHLNNFGFDLAGDTKITVETGATGYQGNINIDQLKHQHAERMAV